MFLEPNFRSQRNGWIEVICGSMFSGKTEELIRRLKRAQIANQNVSIFKPSRDTRYDDTKVVSHDENELISQPIKSSEEVFNHLDNTVNVVGFDEAQFLIRIWSKSLKSSRSIAYGLLSQVSIWTSEVSHLDLFLNYLRSQNT